MLTLFPDQQTIEDELLAAFRKGYKRPLIVAPCGFGKGTVAGDIILKAVAKGSRVLFIVNRRELVRDMSKRLTKLGVYHGILMGAQTRGAHMPVLIASLDTLRNRLKDIPAPNLVFVDEAHMFVTEKAEKLFDTLEDNGAKIIFMTATPWLLSGKGMSKIADCMIEGPQTATLIEQGRLAMPEIYAPEQPDLSQVHITSSGEYDEDEAAQAMSTRKLIGDMVKHWKELAAGCKTVGFAVNRKAAQEYAKAFTDAGVPAIAVDANTSDRDREETWTKLAKGEVMVWSVGIISYGWDVPEVDCIIDAAPTMSLAKHLQRIGRGSRFHPGKAKYIILDHAGNTIKMYSGGHNGLPDSPRSWTLKGRKKRAKGEDEKVKLEQLPLICPQCPPPQKVLKPGTKNCPVCNYEFARSRERQQSEIEVDAEAKLVKVDSRVYIYPSSTGDVQRDAALSIAKERGYDPRWLEHRGKALETARDSYRAKFGVEPKDYWTAGMIKSMLVEAEKQVTLPLAETSGLENWIEGKE